MPPRVFAAPSIFFQGAPPRILFRLGWLFVAICSIGGVGQERLRSAEPKGGSVWKPLFDGQKLGNWKATPFGGAGAVTVVGSRIELEMTDGLTGITWQGEFPRQNYELRLRAMRVEGSDFFCGLTFPVGKSCCSLIVGGWGGTVVGLSSIDDEDAAHNKTTRHERFESGKWYALRVRVSAVRIQAWIDDKLTIDQPRGKHKIAVRNDIALSQPLGIASWNTTAAVTDLQWRPLTEAEIRAVR